MCPRALKHFTSRSNTDATPTREALPLKSRGPRPSEHVGRGGVRLIGIPSTHGTRACDIDEVSDVTGVFNPETPLTRAAGHNLRGSANLAIAGLLARLGRF